MQRRVSCILALSLRRGQVKSLQAARQKTARSLLQQDMGHRWFPEPSGGGTDQWIASNFKAEVNLTTNQACHFEQRILFNLRLSLWQTKKKRKSQWKRSWRHLSVMDRWSDSPWTLYDRYWRSRNGQFVQCHYHLGLFHIILCWKQNVTSEKLTSFVTKHTICYKALSKQ